MEIVAYLGAVLAALALGVALGRYLWPAPKADDLAEAARLAERAAAHQRRVEELQRDLATAESLRDQAAAAAQTAELETARLKEREASLAQAVETQKRQLAELQKQLTTEFENIAGRILKANSAELSESSTKAVGALLTPFRERLLELQQRIEKTYADETREVLSLKEQIKVIMDTSTQLGSQADGLAKALRGDSQMLGRWGELVLERILEAAGLSEGREYVTQGRGLGLKDEEGGAQKPDVLVQLPEGRTMVIDSKAPLASYERLIAGGDAAAANDLVRDMKGHIDSLAAKRYQENPKLAAHDCVLMFVPIEGALAAALTKDPNLFSYGWDRHVVLAGPPTLLMTLRTVASIWRYELQQQNAQEIARLAGDLCDKVSASLGDLNSVGERMTAALTAHGEAVKRLATGKNNVLTIGERIRGLGVKTKKPMPALLVDGEQITAGGEDLALQAGE